MLDYLLVLNLLTLVCSAGIVSDKRVEVSLGEDATLTCSLPGADGVKQVIWQRREGETLRNMVSFTDRSKPHVETPFAGKVNVTAASIQRTTIVIKNVTFADEACYVCTFSVYPSGTERKTTCLSVQGLLKITSQVLSKPKEEDTVVSCSATGKPTPVISFWSEENEPSNYSSNTDTEQNGDGTVTTTSNLTIPQSQKKVWLKCVAKSGSIEWSEVISVEKQMDGETPTASRYYVCSVIVVIICIVLASAIGFLFHQRRRKNQKHLIEDV